MKRRLLVITDIISPYRIPVFNELAAEEDVDLHVVFLSETDPTRREWRVYREEIRFSFEVLPAWRRRMRGGHLLLLNWGLARALRRARPELIVCGGYNWVASWRALVWARLHDVPFFLWCESTLADKPRNGRFIAAMKRFFVAACRGFVVPGRSSLEYLRVLGAPAATISVAPNAVDNHLFSRLAQEARDKESETRERLGLPPRFVLYCGRLVREKGVFDLLEAYARLEPRIRTEVGLVFVGSGAGAPQLRRTAAGVFPGEVVFAGFVQREELPSFYGLAEALVLPTHSDPWGLVVNEAMACGLPVVTTDVAGCAADLVRDGWNGRVVPAGDVSALGQALAFLASNRNEARTMGQRSLELIARYSPASCASGIARVASLARTDLTPCENAS